MVTVGLAMVPESLVAGREAQREQLAEVKLGGRLDEEVVRVWIVLGRFSWCLHKPASMARPGCRPELVLRSRLPGWAPSPHPIPHDRGVSSVGSTSGLLGLRELNQPFYPLCVPESMTRFHIRGGREQDCSEIARLASQLGYPVSGETMRTRLRSLLASPGNVVLVAEPEDGGLVGWIHGVLSQFLESDRRVEIGGLVVDERYHRRGVGRHLVERVEAWAVEHGVMQALVRCQTRRAEAHTFYGSLGYTQAKTQMVFRKPLSLQSKPSPEPKRI